MFCFRWIKSRARKDGVDDSVAKYDGNRVVLYLLIYVVPLTVHLNRRRFQHERPREKKSPEVVLREREDPSGSQFNNEGHVLREGVCSKVWCQ